MVRKFLISSVFVFACFATCACAEDASKTTKVAQNLSVLGRTVTLQHTTGCPKHPTTPQELAKYLSQYDLRVEKDFYSTTYGYSPMASDGYPSGNINKNWVEVELKNIIESGFGSGYSEGKEVYPIAWSNFSGKDNCDFSSYQYWNTYKAPVHRWFLFHEKYNGEYQLVISQAIDGGEVYGNAFSTLNISGDKYPLVVFIYDQNEYFQWNPDIQGFNQCPQNTYSKKPGAFKIYTKTDIAPKNSFLGKLCASPDAQAKLDGFLDLNK